MAEKTYDREDLGTVLANWEWLRKERKAEFDADSNTVVYGDGGADITALAEKGMTPAT